MKRLLLSLIIAFSALPLSAQVPICHVGGIIRSQSGQPLARKPFVIKEVRRSGLLLFIADSTGYTDAGGAVAFAVPQSIGTDTTKVRIYINAPTWNVNGTAGVWIIIPQSIASCDISTLPHSSYLGPPGYAITASYATPHGDSIRVADSLARAGLDTSAAHRAALQAHEDSIAALRAAVDGIDPVESDPVALPIAQAALPMADTTKLHAQRFKNVEDSLAQHRLALDALSPVDQPARDTASVANASAWVADSVKKATAGLLKIPAFHTSNGTWWTSGLGFTPGDTTNRIIYASSRPTTNSNTGLAPFVTIPSSTLFLGLSPWYGTTSWFNDNPVRGGLAVGRQYSDDNSGVVISNYYTQNNRNFGGVQIMRPGTPAIYGWHSLFGGYTRTTSPLDYELYVGTQHAGLQFNDQGRAGIEVGYFTGPWVGTSHPGTPRALLDVRGSLAADTIKGSTTSEYHAGNIRQAKDSTANLGSVIAACFTADSTAKVSGDSVVYIIRDPVRPWSAGAHDAIGSVTFEIDVKDYSKLHPGAGVFFAVVSDSANNVRLGSIEYKGEDDIRYDHWILSRTTGVIGRALSSSVWIVAGETNPINTGAVKVGPQIDATESGVGSLYRCPLKLYQTGASDPPEACRYFVTVRFVVPVGASSTWYVKPINL